MAPSKLDLHSLIVFYYVASEESITAAADKLCLTQPTVTYHIRSLEKNVGLKLLDIRRQKIFLTQAGAGLFQYVKEIYHQMTSAEKYLENLKQDSLRVGIATTFSTCVASAASAFEKLYPNVRLVIRSFSSYDVVEEVLNSQVDLGIVVSMDYDNPKLKSINLSDSQRLVLVASPSSSTGSSCRTRLTSGQSCASRSSRALQARSQASRSEPGPMWAQCSSRASTSESLASSDLAASASREAEERLRKEPTESPANRSSMTTA